MPGFDTSKAYVPQDDVSFDDGRELELLRAIYTDPSLPEMRGHPEKVLEAIDRYGRSKHFLMNVGAAKGRIVTDLIAEVKPQVMVELGGYCAYSAILFGDAVRAAGGRQYWSLERDPVFAAIVMSLTDLAGLRDIVQVVVGASGDSLKRLHHEGRLHHIDLLFLDHYKPAYTSDLKLCEYLRLVAPGSVLAADNVIKPGNPPYLEYVRGTVQQKRAAFEQGGTSNAIDEQFSAGTRDKYKARVGEETLSSEIQGNPNFRYDSKLVGSFEPTGVPNAASPPML
ncbi:MAG: hypothetical protein M1838_004808 [Thelocarpon superellum]|nr:MAG: hypothetical protein M1838_004808 [Thelocarpon superellum]